MTTSNCKPSRSCWGSRSRVRWIARRPHRARDTTDSETPGRDGPPGSDPDSPPTPGRLTGRKTGELRPQAGLVDREDAAPAERELHDPVPAGVHETVRAEDGLELIGRVERVGTADVRHLYQPEASQHLRCEYNQQQTTICDKKL